MRSPPNKRTAPPSRLDSSITEIRALWHGVKDAAPRFLPAGARPPLGAPPGRSPPGTPLPVRGSPAPGCTEPAMRDGQPPPSPSTSRRQAGLVRRAASHRADQDRQAVPLRRRQRRSEARPCGSQARAPPLRAPRPPSAARPRSRSTAAPAPAPPGGMPAHARARRRRGTRPSRERGLQPRTLGAIAYHHEPSGDVAPDADEPVKALFL